jgi:hypothetical protein
MQVPEITQVLFERESAEQSESPTAHHLNQVLTDHIGNVLFRAHRYLTYVVGIICNPLALKGINSLRVAVRRNPLTFLPFFLRVNWS